MVTQEYDPRIALLPEELALTFDESISLEYLESCYRSHIPVCGIVKDVDIESEEFIVSLSDSIDAYLPFKESTIQNFIELSYESLSGKITTSDYSNSLIGLKISVHITQFTPERIEISRIHSLTLAYETIMNEITNPNAIFQCYVLSTSKRSAFVDMGGGILGRIPIKELSCLRYSDIDYWVQPGESFAVKLTSIEENMQFNLSRKKYSLSEISADSFKIGDMITVAIGQSVPKGDGYFVEITPGIAGIMDSKRYLYEGEFSIAIISKIIKDDRVFCGYRFRLDDALSR